MVRSREWSLAVGSRSGHWWLEVRKAWSLTSGSGVWSLAESGVWSLEAECRAYWFVVESGAWSLPAGHWRARADVKSQKIHGGEE